MGKVDLIMPKLGESIMEATILEWHKSPGDSVALDETILEIATDKVDTEIPSPVAGIVGEILFKKDDVVAIGTVIAIIETEEDQSSGKQTDSDITEQPKKIAVSPVKKEQIKSPPKKESSPDVSESIKQSDRFYSPLVLNIAKSENIPIAELEQINGTGAKGRVTKKDLANYISNRTQQSSSPYQFSSGNSGYSPEGASSEKSVVPEPVIQPSDNIEIIEMDRMRKLIADHMINSKRTSAHVTSFIEADVTELVNWRNKHKAAFLKKHGQKITVTPIFLEAVVKALTDFPMVNVSVSGNKIIKKKNINIGMATALPSGNLIVPVIKQADDYNLLGLTKKVNDLATRARNNKLKPEEIQDGTFTLTNVGTFGNVMGTPIINQPQVAILATGAIRKMPAVIETTKGDAIVIRQRMFLSLSYDHRVVDGFLGGSFLKRVADYLEGFDNTQNI